MNLAFLEFRNQSLLGIKHQRFSGEALPFLASDLGHRTTGCKIALQNSDVASFLNWVAQRTNDILVVQHWRIFDVFAQSFSGDGWDITIHQSLVDEEFQDAGETADVGEVRDHVLSGRLEVGKNRYFVGNALEVVDGQVQIGGVRDREEVENGVGGATHHHGAHQCVFQRSERDEISWLDVLLQADLDGVGRTEAFSVLSCRVGECGRGTGECQAHGFDGCRHGVGRVHSSAASGAGTRVLNHIVKIFLGDLAIHESAVCFEARGDVDGLLQAL